MSVDKSKTVKPIELQISRKDAMTAMEYWLNNEVFQDEVEIKNVTFDGANDRFKIIFSRD